LYDLHPPGTEYSPPHVHSGVQNQENHRRLCLWQTVRDLEWLETAEETKVSTWATSAPLRAMVLLMLSMALGKGSRRHTKFATPVEDKAN